MSDARMMEQIALSLGVDNDRLILEEKSLNTYEEAIELKPLLKNDPFVLVTSARHMPRAMMLFQKQGMTPIPAPTDYLSDPTSMIRLEDIIPHSHHFYLWSSVLYEQLAMLKAKLAGNL